MWLEISHTNNRDLRTAINQYKRDILTLSKDINVRTKRGGKKKFLF